MAFYKRVNTAKRTLDRAASVRRRELAITHADLDEADGQQDFDIGAALPAGAIVLYAYVDVTTKFQNAGDTDTTTCDVGVKAGTVNAIIDGADLKTVAKTDATIGAKPAGFFGAVTLQLRVDSDVNVDTLTAGEATVNILYVDPSDVAVAT